MRAGSFSAAEENVRSHDETTANYLTSAERDLSASGKRCETAFDGDVGVLVSLEASPLGGGAEESEEEEDDRTPKFCTRYIEEENGRYRFHKGRRHSLKIRPLVSAEMMTAG